MNNFRLLTSSCILLLALTLVWGGQQAFAEDELRFTEDEILLSPVPNLGSIEGGELFGSPVQENSDTSFMGQSNALPAVGNIDTSAAAPLSEVATPILSLCDPAQKAFVEQDIPAGKLVILGKSISQENSGTANPNVQKIKNTYVCTKLLEPLPLSVLNEGDICIFQAIASTSSGSNTTASTDTIMVRKGSGAGIEDSALGTYGLTPQTVQCTAIGLPSGISAIERYVGIAYGWASMIMGIACVVLMVVGGIMMSMEGANPDIKGTGISMIKNSIIGLAILFLAGALLRLINPTFFT